MSISDLSPHFIPVSNIKCISNDGKNCQPLIPDDIIMTLWHYDDNDTPVVRMRRKDTGPGWSPGTDTGAGNREVNREQRTEARGESPVEFCCYNCKHRSGSGAVISDTGHFKKRDTWQPVTRVNTDKLESKEVRPLFIKLNLCVHNYSNGDV